MSETVKADLMMGFRDKNDGVIWAESTLDVDAADSYLSDYQVAPNADYFSSFFEVKSFSFAMNVRPDDKGTGAMSKQQQSAGGGRSTVMMDEFTRWRSAKNDEYRDIHFPIEFNTFEFTRTIDAASTTFFQSCCNSASFHSAALVKRVSIGSPGNSIRKPRGYLRFDFRDVLMTGLDWSDGDLVAEKCTFICRAMRLRYKQQTQSGELTSTVSTASWPKPDMPTGTIEDVKLLALIAELQRYG